MQTVKETAGSDAKSVAGILMIAGLFLVASSVIGSGALFWFACFMGGAVTGYLALRPRYVAVVVVALALFKIVPWRLWGPTALHVIDVGIGIAAFTAAHVYFRRKKLQR